MPRRIWIALLLATLSSAALSAQTVSGFISGTITDPSGGIVVNAKITLTNEADGGHRETLSNESGAFAFTSVQPGSYSLQIQQTGFKTWMAGFVRVQHPVHFRDNGTFPLHARSM